MWTEITDLVRKKLLKFRQGAREKEKEVYVHEIQWSHKLSKTEK